MAITQGNPILASDLSNIPQIERKVHTGTGTSGTSSNPLSVSFSFSPNMIILPSQWIQGAQNSNPQIIDMELVTTNFSSSPSITIWYSGSGYSLRLKKSSDGKTFYWYCEGTTNHTSIYNGSGKKYIFYGIKTSS